ncbi:MAG: 2-amino-4-hydroxy-6-hydroxymethyldihydropteridine diphosphokinase [Dehalococcoidia bacterium]
MATPAGPSVGRPVGPTVYLGLGANLGNRQANLAMALRGVARMARVEAVSGLYETEPVGGPPQPSFYNACCRVRTGLEPRQLLRFLKKLEEEIGRRPGGEPSGPRPIDLDILLYDDRIVKEEGLVVPHPRLAERAFVLAPLAEIAAEVRHPTLGRTIGELLAAVSQEGVRRIAPPGWAGPLPERLRL